MPKPWPWWYRLTQSKVRDAGWLCHDELPEDLARLARQTSDNVMNGSGLLYIAGDRWS